METTGMFAKIAAACVCIASFALSAAQPPLRDLDCDLEDGEGYERDAENVSVYPAKATAYDYNGIKLPERLGLGVIAVRCGEGEVFLTWRYRMDDPRDVSYRVYCDGKFYAETTLGWMKVPFGKRTGGEFVTSDTTYRVVALDGDGAKISEGEWMVPADAGLGYISIPLPEPPPATTTRTNGVLLAQWQNLPITYTPGDCSAADLDGDGELDLVLKWDPSRHMDNTGTGDSGPQWYEGLKLDGTSLWRVYMGPNTRSGEHYSPFVVWDLDGDGKAEMVVKTSDGTVDAKGNVIGHAVTKDPYDYCTQGNQYDYRDSYGKIVYGNEYLTVFNGETGEAMQTVLYTPCQGSNVKDAQDCWGDTWFNRSERYLTAVGYFDGTNACAVMCRGYYHRTALTAWRWDGKNLSRYWQFDTTNHNESAYQNGTWKDFMGQGDHSLRVADVDFDGKDEVIYGSMVVDHDGTGLFSMNYGHGDAMHLIQMDSAKRGLQMFTCHEASPFGVALWDCRTGYEYWRHTAGSDTGRCVCGDCDPTVRGYEYWGGNALGVYDNSGKFIYDGRTSEGYVHNLAMMIWWGDDFDRYGLGAGTSKWDTEMKKEVGADKWVGVTTINSTKGTPCIAADLYGDWREEAVLPTTDYKTLRMFVSTNATPYKLHTFLQDPPYRESVANEQNGYNQPTQPGFYFGPDLHGHRMWFRGQYIE